METQKKQETRTDKSQVLTVKTIRLTIQRRALILPRTGQVVARRAHVEQGQGTGTSQVVTVKTTQVATQRKAYKAAKNRAGARQNSAHENAKMRRDRNRQKASINSEEDSIVTKRRA